MIRSLLMGGSLMLLSVPAFAQSVNVTAEVMVEKPVAAADGTTSIVLSGADRATPGDRVVYVLDYRNDGAAAADDLVLANPVPDSLVYAGPASGMPTPEVSVDGSSFAPIGELQLAGDDGALRPAALADVRAVRWRLTEPLAPGEAGRRSFRATIK